jgi:hypothetical protein
MPKKLSWEEIKSTAESKGLVLVSTEYKNTVTPIVVRCPIHGDFEMLPKKIRKNAGCRRCSYKKMARSSCRSPEEVAAIVGAKNLELVSYPYPEAISLEDKVVLRCRSHGEFSTKLETAIKGSSVCRACGYESLSRQIRITDEELKSKADEIGVEFIKSLAMGVRRVALFKCRRHGEFKKNVTKFISGRGCPECGDDGGVSKRRNSIEDVVKILEPNGYEIIGDYVSMNLKTLLRCPRHGEFEMRIQSIKNGHRCRKCGNGTSKPQDDIAALVKSLDLECREDDRKAIAPKEIDVYIESKKLGIEYCGLYWHSEEYKDKKYHKEKLDLCQQQGIALLTIFEDEWLLRRPQVELFIKAKLGAVPKLNARDCEVVVLDKREADDFVNAYHIQGRSNHLIAFGLRHPQHGLVAVMTAGRHHRGLKDLVLNRLCLGEFAVRGGASRLAKALISWGQQNNYSNLVSWSDNRWSQGGVYAAMGFERSEDLAPDYSYTDSQKRWSKQSCTKKALAKKGGVGATEAEMATSLGLVRIWDCGKVRWSLGLL